MGKPRAVTPETFGAWLLRGSRQATPIDALMRTGFSDVTGWCIRPTYRTDLVSSGQLVLFWLSGDDPTAPAGIYAQGVTLGSPTLTDADEAGGRLTMPVSLQPVEPPILRSWLLRHPALSQLEVLKMAAGSNPSYLTRDQVAELRAAWPHLTVADAASWRRRGDRPGSGTSPD